jgi:Protein of unknown function (DUF4239)
LGYPPSRRKVEPVLTTPESVFVIIVIVASSLAFLFVLNLLWEVDDRRQHNDIVGWQVSVVGMTYAVIIGFMLYAVWNNFEVADANASAEANSLVNVSRLAEGLPEQQRQTVQSVASRYANAMVEHEWPAMSRNSLTGEGQKLTQELWAAVIQPEELTPAQQTSLDHSISQLTELTEHRRLRELESKSGLPTVLWWVLTLGAIITIASACLFGTKSFPLHMLQVFGLSFLIALCLVAIAEIDRPFQGSVHVKPEAFIRARDVLQIRTAKH